MIFEIAKSISQINSKKYAAEGALLVVTLLWGATFSIIKESLPDISSMLFVAFRFSIAAIILLPLVLRNLERFNKQSIRTGLILGAIMFGSYATQTVGLKFTSATRSGFITGTAVVMIPLLQLLIEKRRPTKGTLAGVAIVFAGILFLSSGGNSINNFLSELGGNFNTGEILTLFCAGFYSLYVIFLDIFSKKIDFLVLLFLQIIVCASLGFLSAFIFDSVSLENIHVEFSNKLIFGLLYTSLFATLITIALQTKFQKEVTPTKAGIVYSFEPIFAAVIAFFLLNEKITNFGLIGCSLIFLGLIVSETYESMKKKYGKRVQQG